MWEEGAWGRTPRGCFVWVYFGFCAAWHVHRVQARIESRRASCPSALSLLNDIHLHGVVRETAIVMPTTASASTSPHRAPRAVADGAAHCLSDAVPAVERPCAGRVYQVRCAVLRVDCAYSPFPPFSDAAAFFS